MENEKVTPKPVFGSPEWMAEVFTYHHAGDEQRLAYEKVREAAKQFATVIIANSPRCADQTAAVRLVREAVMTVNAAISLKGLV